MQQGLFFIKRPLEISYFIDQALQSTLSDGSTERNEIRQLIEKVPFLIEQLSASNKKEISELCRSMSQYELIVFQIALAFHANMKDPEDASAAFSEFMDRSTQFLKELVDQTQPGELKEILATFQEKKQTYAVLLSQTNSKDPSPLLIIFDVLAKKKEDYPRPSSFS